ncbi:MAG: tetratricopeptide repeat protein [Actinobacteria bacterium]|nr:MAG: tetratricopeptide repeat protein [Actinomycetota bacterium]
MKLPGRFGRRRAINQAGELRRAGDAAGAVDLLAPVLLADAEDAAANVEMARALHVLGDLEGAEEHYRRALREELDYKLVVELAGVVGSAGRIKEAEELLGAALQMTEAVDGLDPGEALLVSATLAAGQGRNDDARAILDEIDAGTSGPEVREYAGRLRDRLGASS